ncbi:PDR/VanB family oxidoreductase [Noviherbaspirillum malthae]|uniref:PDR/VanB family oxidoreductase n=1 Tax=Noviherbaspirillum malthae TaxID=1260987 RepID=UPI001E5F2CE7|nr:PDR/VanB family oxidoreductase [Noviherbaspirillum malthae]
MKNEMQGNALLSVRVARKQAEAEGICTFELRDVDNRRLPAFTAGAHVDVHVAPGIVRQYSLCSDPRNCSHYLIGVLKEPGSRGGSRGMHEKIHEGDLLHISVPANHFALQPARKTLLFAGGIGITPIICMAEQLSAEGADFSLHYCVRSLPKAAFLARMEAAPYSRAVHLHVDDTPPAERFDPAAILRDAAPDSHLYVCGPAGYVAWITQAARDADYPPQQVHVEYFAAPGSPVFEDSDNADFQVRIASTGRTYSIGSDQTIVDALADCGVEIPVSCKEGVCGTCLTRVLDGEVDHRDYYLSQAEQACHDQMLPCCSRAKGRMLVLDL